MRQILPALQGFLTDLHRLCEAGVFLEVARYRILHQVGRIAALLRSGCRRPGFEIGRKVDFHELLRPIICDETGQAHLSAIGVESLTMKATMFSELLKSVREAGAILRGETKPSRRFPVAASGVQAVHEQTKVSQTNLGGSDPTSRA